MILSNTFSYFTPHDPVGWCISQIRKSPRRFPQPLWEDIKKRGYEDFKQNLYLYMQILPNRNPRTLLKVLSRAFYYTARELGWRRLRTGQWVYSTVLIRDEES